MKMNKYLKEIMNYVIDQTGLDIRDNTRKREYVYARSLYYKLSRECTAFPLSEIGEVVGRDHAGVIHSINNVFSEACDYSPLIKDSYLRYLNFKKTGKFESDDVSLLQQQIAMLKNTNNEVLDIVGTLNERHRPLLLERLRALVKMLNATPYIEPRKQLEMEGAEL
jgi:hypothetical protein